MSSASLPPTYTQIVLHKRPVGEIESDTFRKEVIPSSTLISSLDAPDAPADSVLIKVLWLSLDPAMRGYLRDARSYLPPVKIGEVMRSMALAVVLRAGEGSKYKVGSYVSGAVGWREYAVMQDKDLEEIVYVPFHSFFSFFFLLVRWIESRIDGESRLPPGAQLLDFLNTLGTSGAFGNLCDY